MHIHLAVLWSTCKECCIFTSDQYFISLDGQKHGAFGGGTHPIRLRMAMPECHSPVCGPPVDSGAPRGLQSYPAINGLRLNGSTL